MVDIINDYFRSQLNVGNTSNITVKHSLFLTSFCHELQSDSIISFNYFIANKCDDIFSQVYTNHILVLKWIFNHSKCDNFCKFALKKFIEFIPEEFLINCKFNIISFIQLINSNEKVFHLLKNLLRDELSLSALNMFEILLTNGDYFDEESDVCNDWAQFAHKLFIVLPEIILFLINKLNPKKIKPCDERKLSKLIQILCQMLSNESNKLYMYSKEHEFQRFNRELCYFIDENLNISTIGSFFEFFKICLTSDSKQTNSYRNAIIDFMLKSSIPIILMVRYVTEDCHEMGLKELSIKLLSILTKYQSKLKIENNLIYNLDMKTICVCFDTNSNEICESAFSILINSFNTKLYFASNHRINNENIDALQEEKVENIRKLLISLQNAVFRSNITIKQMIKFWNRILYDILEVSVNLFQHLVNNPWFRIIIENLVLNKEWYYLDEELVDFLILFYRESTINRALIGITNQIVRELVDLLQNPEQAFLKVRFEALLKAINCSRYRNILNDNNREDLYSVLYPID